MPGVTKAVTLPKRELKTEDDLHYVKFEGAEGFVLANEGLTNWSESLNSETQDGTQWIGSSTGTSNVTGYSPSVEFSNTAYPSDAFSKWLYDIHVEQKVGQTFEEVTVQTWNEAPEGGGTKFVAIKHTYEVQPESKGGEGGGNIVIAGKFAQQGEPEKGTFDVSAKTFAPAV